MTTSDKPRSRWTPDYIALWVIALVSLLTNAFMFRQVILVKAAAGQAITDSIAILEQFEQTSITTDIEIDQTIVIETDLPVNETLPVEIKDTIPIDTIVTVPVDAGLLGKLNLKVPIKTTIPVNLKPTVTIDRTFHVKAPVPIKLTVPIKITAGSAGLGPMLAEVKARLRALAIKLDAPLLPAPAATDAP